MMIGGAKCAASKNTSRVVSVTRESQPPMTPPSATAFLSSAMTRNLSVSACSLPSSSFSFSPFARAAHDDGAGHFRVVERVQRLAELDHDVVGDVDDRADRTQARTAQTLGEPERRLCAGIDAFDHAAEITRAIGTGIEADRALRLDRVRLRFDLGRMERRVANSAPTSRARPCTLRQSGRFGVSLSSMLASGRPRYCAERFADRRIGRQLHQARRVGVDAELLRRAQHAVRIDAAQRGLLDLDSVRQFRADRRERRLETDARIRRAADDLQRSSPPAATLQTRSLSAFGCFSQPTISPTTTPSSAAPIGSTPSTSRPDIVRRCTSASRSTGMSTSSRSQFSRISSVDH